MYVGGFGISDKMVHVHLMCMIFRELGAFFSIERKRKDCFFFGMDAVVFNRCRTIQSWVLYNCLVNVLLELEYVNVFCDR